jgi:uncharacterized protein YoxC
MATEKEEVVLEFKVEQGDAINELERTKKSILGVKQEQQELNKAYKAGNITLDEYVQDSVRLEGILKKQQSSYNTLQKSVTGVTTQLDKLIKSNEKVSKDFQKSSQAFQDAAKNINIAGVSVGDISTKLAAFANPATAAVGLVGALGAAYARSTIGAKDLDFAQNQLAISTTILTNSFASLISSSEDGEGAVTSLFNAFLFKLSPQLQAQTKILTRQQEELEDLSRKELEVRSNISERLGENQEKLTAIASEQTSYNDKVRLGNEIVENLNKNQDELKNVLQDQLGIMKIALAFDQENEKLQTEILKKEREINKLVADTTKKKNAQIRANDNLVQSTNKLAAEERRIARESGKSGLSTDTGSQSQIDAAAVSQSVSAVTPESQVNVQQGLNNATAELDKQRTENAKAESQRRLENQIAYDQAVYESAVTSAIMINDAMSVLFKEGSDAQKFFAFSSILVSTADAIAKATAAASGVPFPGNLAAIASSVATVLGNIANAKQIFSQAAGGGDFVTRGPSLLMVGDNPGGVERVTVEPISGKGQTKVYGPNLVAMAGGGSITTNPGGLISNSLGADVNQQLMMANMFKMMPAQVIGLQQFNKANDKLIKKQFAVRI